MAELDSVFPGNWQAARLRALLLERGKQIEAIAGADSLLVQVAGPASGAFSRIATFVSLANLEERRAKLAADPGQAEFFRRSAELMSRPTETTIHEILIPFA